MARWDLIDELGGLGDLVFGVADSENEVALVVTSQAVFTAIDLSNQAALAVRDSVDLSGTNRSPNGIVLDTSRARAIAVSDTEAEEGNVDLFDYSDPTNLQHVDEYIGVQDFIRPSINVNEGDQIFYVLYQNSVTDEGYKVFDYVGDQLTLLGSVERPDATGRGWGGYYENRRDFYYTVFQDRPLQGDSKLTVWDVDAGGGGHTFIDEVLLPGGAGTRERVNDMVVDPSRPEVLYLTTAFSNYDVIALEFDGATLTILDTLTHGSRFAYLDYVDAEEEIYIVGRDTNTDVFHVVDASDPSNLSLVDSAPGYPNSPTNVDIPNKADLYKQGQVGFLADFTEDYVSTWTTEVPAPNDPPAKPTCNVDSVDQREADLSSSAFSDPDGDPHDSSRWQVRDQGDADWSTPEYDSGWTATDLTTHTTDRVLTPGTDYEARVAHRDPDGAFTWSDPVAFTTEALEEVPAIGPEGFFFGPDGRNDLLKFGGVHEDAGNPITGEMLHRAIAPRGAAGEALFRYVRVTITYATEFSATITPVLDGEELTSESVTFTRSAPSGQKTETIEVELARGSSFARRGLRGTWIRTLLELTETAGHAGYIAIDGIEYEWEPVRETTAALTFHQENLSVASLPTVTRFFFGAGNELGEFGAARDDLGTAVEAVLHSNPVAPAGSGGEAIFTNLYLALTRANPSDVPLNVTAIVDETSYSVGPVSLGGVANPKLEVLEIPLTRQITRDGSPVGRAHLRGSWCEIEMDTDGSLPDGDIIFETAELEHEVVQESEGDVGG